jgi:hypothetical protein
LIPQKNYLGSRKVFSLMLLDFSLSIECTREICADLGAAATVAAAGHTASYRLPAPEASF